LLAEIESLTDSCGVNGAVVAFAGPFAHTIGVLAGRLGDHTRAKSMLEQSIETSQRLGATVWVRHGEAALRAIEESEEPDSLTRKGDSEVATLTQTGRIWAVSWRNEHGSLAHAKGLTDIAALIRHRGQGLSALELAGAPAVLDGANDTVIDVDALNAYRERLDELAEEADRANDDADIGWIESLELEREQLLAEIRSATGLGGRLRTSASNPAERARKAVSARIRDAIRRIEKVAPLLSAHLDRSIRTGLSCSYTPPGDEPAIRWEIGG
jgi:hypothetical protein